MYFYYNQPLIYIKKKAFGISDYFCCRFMFAKPDNGNYLIKIDEIISMYIEVTPDEIYTFDSAIQFIKGKKDAWEEKITKWHKRDDFMPPEYLVRKIIDTERMIEVLNERYSSCVNDEKRENYRKQIQREKKALRRFHKRTYEFETDKNGCDIHLLTHTDFSKTRISEKLDELEKIKEKIESYKENIKDEKAFII